MLADVIQDPRTVPNTPAVYAREQVMPCVRKASARPEWEPDLPRYGGML